MTITTDVVFHGSDTDYNLLGVADLLLEDDLLVGASDCVITPQVNIKLDGGDYGGWQTLTNGEYTGRYFNFRLSISVLDSTTSAYVHEWTWEVDMEDRIDSERNISTLSGGTAISFSR